MQADFHAGFSPRRGEAYDRVCRDLAAEVGGKAELQPMATRATVTITTAAEPQRGSADAFQENLPGDEALMRKVMLRLLPFLFFLYVIAYIDRVNVGFAKLEMNQLGWFSEKIYGFGAGIFFAGYFLFEVPSNLLLQKFGARKWIARIMISWGLVAIAMMFVSGEISFYVLRFTLGVAEAGFFPGVLLYMTYWFTSRERARVVAWFMTAGSVAFILGGPLSGAILQLPPVLGLTKWQQLFLLEGLPAVLMGVVVWLVLPNGPRDVRWLTPAEKERVVGRVESERGLSAHTTHNPLWLLGLLKQPGVYLLCLVYFANATTSYGFSLWVPQIVKSLSTLTSFEVGLITAIPYLCQVVGLIANGTHSDRTGERRFHLFGATCVAALGFTGAAFLIGNTYITIACLSVAAFGMGGILGPFWAMPTQVLRRVSGPAALAGGIALINSVGNLGGWAGPYVMGLLKANSGEFTRGLLFIACTILIGGFHRPVGGTRSGSSESFPPGGEVIPTAVPLNALAFAYRLKPGHGGRIRMRRAGAEYAQIPLAFGKDNEAALVKSEIERFRLLQRGPAVGKGKLHRLAYHFGPNLEGDSYFSLVFSLVFFLRGIIHLMSISKKRTGSLLAFGLTLLLGGAGNQTYAQTEPIRGTPFTTLFLRVYRDYLDATNQEEANGLRKVAVSDFTIYDDSLSKPLRGEEAFVSASKIYNGTKNNLRHDMRFCLAKVTDQYAITYAEESISTLVDVKDTLSLEQRARVSTTALKSTATWLWKHTWRKTPLGWKLASLSPDNRSDAERRADTNTVYYVVTKPKPALATDPPESAKP